MPLWKINAVTVPDEKADEFQHRFATRARLVEQVDGFLEFRLLRPADERQQWLVCTLWRDEEAFQGWVGSQAFRDAHTVERQGGPVGTHSELWSFAEVQSETKPHVVSAT